MFNTGYGMWHQENCEGGGADRRIGHTITFDPEKKVIYVYGGSKNKRWFSDINILDLQTNTWSAVKVCANKLYKRQIWIGLDWIIPCNPILTVCQLGWVDPIWSNPGFVDVL